RTKPALLSYQVQDNVVASGVALAPRGRRATKVLLFILGFQVQNVSASRALGRLLGQVSSYGCFLEDIIVLRRSWLIVIPALAFLAAPALGQAPVDLKWKFEKGKIFYQEMTTETKQEMQVMWQKISQ